MAKDTYSQITATERFRDDTKGRLKDLELAVGRLTERTVWLEVALRDAGIHVTNPAMTATDGRRYRTSWSGGRPAREYVST